MVIAWIPISSTGILLARYYKHLFVPRKFCDVQFWYAVHRPLMISVPIITIAAFIVILWQLEWKWLVNSKDLLIAFIHSIVGIICIALSVIQVSIKRILKF
jgi:hypothetical protein